MKSGYLLRVFSIGIIFIAAILLSTRTTYSENPSASMNDVQAIRKELEDIERQMTGLVVRQEKLLKDLESLKVIARRN